MVTANSCTYTKVIFIPTGSPLVHTYQVILCVYIYQIMIPLYVCIPNRYNGHTSCVYTYYGPTVYLTDIMVPLYVCIPTMVPLYT